MQSVAVAALGLMTVGCSPILDDGIERERMIATLDDGIERERMIATIESYGDPVVIELPDTVASGEGFAVHVRTYGPDCGEEGDTEVEIGGLRAIVTPYDIEVTHLPKGVVCAGALILYDHIGNVRFDQSGPAIVEVRGRRKPENVVISVERPVFVR